MKKVIYTSIICLVASFITRGQDSSATSFQKDSLLYFPFQMSFVYPIGTNGMQSARTVNNISLNAFAGYNAGLDGIELGGFANTLRFDMRGIQFAGFSNTVLGKTNGVQCAGFSNISRGKLEGAQVAGFMNTVNDSVKGIQSAGFANVVNGDMQAIQAAGFANTVKGKVRGIQAAGFANVTSDSISGMQLAGYINVSKKDVEGAQIAGYLNIANGDIKGAQISGFMNMAKKINGIQLGVINISDTIEKGVAIGLINYVRKGYRGFEVSGSEGLQANLSFKMGTDRFYNIITAGYASKPNNFLYGFGYGAGTKIPVAGRTFLNIEGLYYHINESKSEESKLYTSRLNSLTKINILFGATLKGKIEVFAGPTLNLQITQRQDENGDINSSLAPYTHYHYKGDYTHLKFWTGVTAGIRI